MDARRDELIRAFRAILRERAGLKYAVLFGSFARGEAGERSDADVAVRGLVGGERLSLIADLEAAAGRRVDVVPIESAPLALRYRIFRDGIVLAEPDRTLRIADQARAIVEYLDFRPVEDIMVRGVLRAAREGRLRGR